MENYNRIEKEWIRTLGSSNIEQVINTLNEIRNSGSINILPFLLKMIHKNTDDLVRNEILKLVSEIRSQEAVTQITESIEQNDFGDDLPAFIAACWMSGLDFSKHLSIFTNLFIRKDYLTALEAFTVIEESLSQTSDIDLIECLRFLREAECMMAEEKMPLYRELRKVVEGR
jgi:hypothetical protein